MSRRLAALDLFLRLVAKPRFARVREPAVARAEFARLARLAFRAPPYLVRLPATVGVPGLWLWSGPVRAEAAILYFHGGGYIAGSPDTHAALAGRLSRLSGLRAFAPDYRLAPEHPFPAAFEDAVTAWEGLLARGYAPGRIALAGDSAGGGLALALLAELCRRGTPPAAATLFSPFCDLTGSAPSIRANAGADAMLPAERFAELADLFLAGAAPEDPRASPLFADFPAPPPVLIQASDVEILQDDAVRAAERLRQAGGAVTLSICRGAPHAWQIFDGWVPEARAALAEAAAFLRDRLSPVPESPAGS